MQKMYKPIRIGIIFILMAAMLLVFVSALYRIQIYETRPLDEEDETPSVLLSRVVSIPAARGNIYDRNGVKLTSGRPSYNVTLHWRALRQSGRINESIQEVIYLAMDEGINYNDSFPITRGAPFSYMSDMTRTQRSRLDAYIDFHSALYPGISASDLLAWMRGHYGIDYTIGISAARLIIGVRYELETREIMGNIVPYVFAADVTSSFASLISERGMVGVNIESAYVREHLTPHAPHILGYIASIPGEDIEIYRELGYPMDALVGQMGVELAFESQLRGVDGRQIIRTTEDGTIISVVTEREPEPGQHIYLSLDIGTQIATENALRTQIDLINMEREEEDDRITGGAVVVTDVNTGEVLASASYPTFNPITLSQDFPMLTSDERRPIWNRAVNGRYVPGSTFKMVTGFAGLRNGAITRHYPFEDTGVFRYYEHHDGFTANCWIYPLAGVGHGGVDIVQALECSCNFFFLMTAAKISHFDEEEGVTIEGGAYSAEEIGQAAREFGLGLPTGIEIRENTGFLSTPENRLEARDEGWWLADTVLTGFGQGDNRFTPLQLANYTATIANGGTLNSLTILRMIMSADFLDVIYVHEPEVLHVIPETEYIEILQEGMVAVSRGGRGTARSVFGDYHIQVASKTGTAQVEGRDINDGIFVAYAPADNPQIAISIVVEKGGSGSAVMDIARMVFDYYFRSESSVLAVPYGVLIP